MSDYKEESVSGAAWVRAYSINIANPYHLHLAQIRDASLAA